MNKALFYLIIFCFLSFIANPTRAHEESEWQTGDAEGVSPRLVVFEAFMRCA